MVYVKEKTHQKNDVRQHAKKTRFLTDGQKPRFFVLIILRINLDDKIKFL